MSLLAWGHFFILILWDVVVVVIIIIIINSNDTDSAGFGYFL
jgi:hypothetical protein